MVRAAALAIVAVIMLAGCGSTRVVRHAVYGKPCSTVTRMNACVADFARATARDNGLDPSTVHTSCSQHATHWQCVLLAPQPGGAVCISLRVATTEQIGLPYPSSTGSSYLAMARCDGVFGKQ